MMVGRTEEECKLSIDGEDIEHVKNLMRYLDTDQCKWEVC